MTHAWLYSDLLQALKGKPLSSGFSKDGSLISASAVRHYWRFLAARAVHMMNSGSSGILPGTPWISSCCKCNR